MREAAIKTDHLCTVNGYRVYRHMIGNRTRYSCKRGGKVTLYHCSFQALPYDVKEAVALAVHQLKE